jgi:hypothetical protein
MSRTLRPLAALAMLALIVAGCSKAPAGTGSSNSTAAAHEKAVKFAEWRRQRRQRVPDPSLQRALLRVALRLTRRPPGRVAAPPSRPVSGSSRPLVRLRASRALDVDGLRGS